MQLRNIPAKSMLSSKLWSSRTSAPTRSSAKGERSSSYWLPAPIGQHGDRVPRRLVEYNQPFRAQPHPSLLSPLARFVRRYHGDHWFSVCRRLRAAAQPQYNIVHGAHRLDKFDLTWRAAGLLLRQYRTLLAAHTNNNIASHQ